MAVHQRKARKQHRCDYCDGQIEVGETYHHQSDRGFMMGTVIYSNIRAHMACAGLISQALEDVAEYVQQSARQGAWRSPVLDLDRFWETGDASKATMRFPDTEALATKHSPGAKN